MLSSQNRTKMFIDQRIPGSECLRGPVLLQIGLLRRVPGTSIAHFTHCTLNITHYTLHAVLTAQTAH